MPLRLFFSNSLESLSEVLREILLLRGRDSDSLFSFPRIVIPNPNVKRWLQLRIAQRDGACLDLGLSEMRDTLHYILNQLGGMEEPRGLLSQTEFQIYVFRALCRILDLVQEPACDGELIEPELFLEDLSPILHYLCGDQSAPRPSGRHLWQLSVRLSSLFQEYYHHRYRELISKWEDWISSRKSQLRRTTAMERAQFRVYEMTRILRLRDAGSQGVERKLLLFELAEEVLGDLKKEPVHGIENDLPDLHIFGLSQIFDFHQLLIHHLSKSLSIFIYTYNPCREFWEDVETPFEEYRRRLVQGKRSTLISSRNRISDEEAEKGEIDFPMESDVYVLRAWGRPGRENIRLLCELAQYDVDWVPGLHIPEDPSHDSILTRLQRQILTRSPRQYPQRPQNDGSLHVLACPSIFREVETIRQLILKSIREDPSLSLNEIAVLVPSMSTYKPVLEAVLSREPGEIPFHLVDSTAGEDSLFARAVLSILEILRLGATRPRLFRLFRNPCFYENFELDCEGVETLLEWCESLNALHEKPCVVGAKTLLGEEAPFGFHQALKRLRLGLVMESDASLLGRESAVFHTVLPCSLPGLDEPRLLESFSLAVELLEIGRKEMKSKQRDLGSCVGILEKLIEELLTVPGLFPVEDRIRMLVQSELRRIFEIAAQGYEMEKIPMDGLEFLSFYLEENLNSAPSTIGKYLGRGVTVAAMRPMRPLPFRVVFVPGLQEGGFPGIPDKSTLDLRIRKRKIGDATRMEKDCYLFLELLTSTREKLFLSYINRDLQKDERYQTCQVLNQLIRCVESDVLDEGGILPIQEIPLSGSHPAYFHPVGRPPNLVNFELSDRLTFLNRTGLDRTMNSGEVSPSCALFQENYQPECDTEVLAHQHTTSDFHLRVTLRELASFLREPGYGVLSRWYQFYQRPEKSRDLSVKEVESFRPDYDLQSQLEVYPIQRLFEEARSNGADVDFENVLHYFEETCRSLEYQAKMPVPPYGTFAKRRANQSLHQRIKGFQKGILSRLEPGTCKLIRLLDPAKAELLDQRGVLPVPSPDFRIQLRSPWEGKPPGTYQVTILGAVAPVCFLEDEPLHFIQLLMKDPEPKMVHPFSLESFLCAVLLHSLDRDQPTWKQLSKIGCQRGANILEMGPTTQLTRTYQLEEPHECRRYLEDLLQDFLEKREPVYFPYKEYAREFQGIFEKGSLAELVLEYPHPQQMPEMIRIAGLSFPENPGELLSRRYQLLASFSIKGKRS